MESSLFISAESKNICALELFRYVYYMIYSRCRAIVLNLFDSKSPHCQKTIVPLLWN